MSDGKEPPPGHDHAPVVERLVRVDAVEGDHAWVIADRRGGCGSCAERGGCGHAALREDVPPMRLKVPNRLAAEPGEWVVLGIRSDSLLGSSMLAYGLPLGGFLGGAMAGAVVAPAAAIGGGVVGLAAMLGVCRWLFARRARQGRAPAQPRMIRFAPPPMRDGCIKA